MTETVLKEIVHRAVSDGAFRAQLRNDAATALAGFSLTTEERTAITSGDPARLSALGIDQRMSKAFGLGVLQDASKVVIATDVGAGGAAFIDEGPGGSTVIVGDPASGEAPAATEVSAFGQHLWRVEQDLDTSAAEAAAATAPETVHSSMWRIEQDLDAGASLDATATDLTQTDGTQVTDLNQDY